MHRLTSKNIIFWISLIRIISALPILFNPLWGFIIFVVIDYIDAYFPQHFAGMGWNTYQQWDKKFDIPGYLAMTYVGIMNGFGILFVIFFIYRMIGEGIFFASKKQSVLLFFPNFIEPYFVWAILIGKTSPSIIWLILLFGFQIGLEYFLHIFWPKYLRNNEFPKLFRTFGLTKVENWD